MSTTNNTIHLLFINVESDETEQTVSGMRNKGKATRAHLTDNEPGLHETLTKATCDIIIANFESENINPNTIIDTIQKHGKDIPVIFLVQKLDEDKRLDILNLGAANVVQVDCQELLTLIIDRELASLYQRRELYKTDTALIEAEKRSKTLLETSRDAVAYVAGGMHIYANQPYLDIFGYAETDEVDCLPILDLVSSKDQGRFKEFLKEYSSGKAKDNAIKLLGQSSDGSDIELEFKFSEAQYEGEECTQIIVRSENYDVELQEKLKSISHQDLLTGVYNRNYFLSALEKSIQTALEQQKHFMLYFIRLNEHENLIMDIGIGGIDLILSDIARLIEAEIPKNGILAHFNDDVFTMMTQEESPEEAIKLANLICEKIENHLPEVQEKTIRLSVRVGVCAINDASSNPQTMIMRAHAASDKVKESSKEETGVHFYTNDEGGNENGEPQSVVQLQKAIEGGLFKILFQPIISLRGGTQPFYEVLLRMLDEDGEEISPQEFLKTAIAYRMAEKIDRWVIIQSFKELAESYKNGIKARIIINLTPQTLLDDSFLSWLAMVLKASRLPHNALVFQLNELDANNYLKQAQKATKALSKLHCKISISRFGNSPNPFNILKHVAADYLKLDGSYTNDLSDKEKIASLKEVVETAHKHGKQTIASFVEEVRVISSLYTIGMNFIQGYYLQQPSETMNYDFELDDEDD